MHSHAAHIISSGEGQATADDEVRNAAFERIRWSVDEISFVDQIEADLCAKCIVIPAAGHLTEAAADISGAVMSPGPVAIASAVDVVDQFNPEIRIACK